MQQGNSISPKSKMTTIAIDAMGGDNAPGEIVKGVAQASHDFDARYILVGDRNALEREIEIHQPRTGTVEIHDTDEFIAMDESPRSGLESKPKASIVLASKLVNEDKADALLSAGNTGSVILAASKHIPMLDGVERSALAAILPTAAFETTNTKFTLLLDVGATIHCDVKHLVHFAFMGSVYAKDILGVENPKVGLLNVGEEETKGGFTLTKTYKILKEIPELNFTGNIEGNELVSGKAHVVVCDGFSGNTLLKMMEGFAESFVKLGEYAYSKNFAYKIALAILSSGLKKLKKKFDYAEYGGAPLMGFRKLCIKAHGKSNAKAIKNAIRVAIKSSKNNMCDRIAGSVAEINKNVDFSEIAH